MSTKRVHTDTYGNIRVTYEYTGATYNSGVRLLMELYCAVVIKHVAFFSIFAKLTVVFTCTSFPLNIYTSVFGCDCGFGFEQKFWRIDGFGEKKARIGGFTYPYSPPSLSKISAGRESLRTFNVVFAGITCILI